METKRVLSIGQCAADTFGLRTFFRSHFSALTVETADSATEAIGAMKTKHYDLVLVNRLLDRDGSSGLDIIRTMKSVPELSSLPVMLVSNFADAQAEATAVGAAPGFGKAELDDGAADRIRAALGVG